MCDEDTEAENALYLQQAGLERRQWTLGATATLAALVTGCGPSSTPSQATSTAPEPPTPPTAEAAPEATAEETTTHRMVTIDTPDGSAEAFFVTPKSGKSPAVLMWPDVAGLRDAFLAMATRLAEAGYAVLAVNPYYRSSKLPVLKEFNEWRSEEGRTKIAPMIEALSSEGIASDGKTFVAWLDAQPEVDTERKVGSMGYCMSGSFTFRTAAASPDRVGAIGSFHGGGLATEEADSPHTLFASMQAAALVCIAQNDDERDPKAKETLLAAAQEAKRAAEIEVYPANHGWCVLDSPVYDEVQADKAWARMLETFELSL